MFTITTIFRLGSFTSSVKIDNEDSQDKELNFDSQVTFQQLLEYCQTHNDQCPHSQLIKRTFSTIPHGQYYLYNILNRYVIIIQLCDFTCISNYIYVINVKYIYELNN